MTQIYTMYKKSSNMVLKRWPSSLSNHLTASARTTCTQETSLSTHPGSHGEAQAPVP